jgi:hypothetical protein
VRTNGLLLQRLQKHLAHFWAKGTGGNVQRAPTTKVGGARFDAKL